MSNPPLFLFWCSMANQALSSKRRKELIDELRAILGAGSFTAYELAYMVSFRYNSNAKIIAQFIRIHMKEVKARRSRGIRYPYPDGKMYFIPENE